MTNSRLLLLASAILLLGACSPSNEEPTSSSTTSVFIIPSIPTTSTSVKPTETKIEDFTFELNENGTYDITDYNNFEPLKVVIPESFEGIAVTGIQEHAFKGKTSGIETIVLSKNITSCSPNSFFESFMINSIEVDPNNSVYASEDGLLLSKDKTQLLYAPQAKETVTLPSSVKTIADYGFKNSRAKSITLNDGLETIGNFVFDLTKKLESLTIPNSVTTIGEEILSTSGIKELKIGTGISYLPPYFLNNCDNLVSLTIPGNVKTIGEVAIYENSYLQHVTLEEGVETIEYGAFANNAIVDIKFPNSLRTIGEEAFIRNWNIDNVVIPEGVTSIGNSAFYACDDLSSVSLPTSLTSIGHSVFAYCPNLSSISVNESSEYFVVENGALLTKDKTRLISYAGNFDAFDYSIPSSVLTIDKEAFAGAKRLKNVTIPTSVTKIGSYCFGGCTYITTVTYLGTHQQWMQIETTETEQILNDDGSYTSVYVSWSDSSYISKLICSDREITIK